MFFKFKQLTHIGLLALSGLGLSACGDKGPSDEAITELKKNLKANMVLVKGGTFMMGDQGRMVTDEQGNQRLLYWTSARNNKPAVEVTLSDYSI